MSRVPFDLAASTVIAVALGGACVRPVPLTDARILGDLAARFDDFHDATDDPDAQSDAVLLRPRLGLPDIARVGDGLPLAWLERGRSSAETARAVLVRHDLVDAQALACLQATVVQARRIDGCTPLRLEVGQRARLRPPAVARIEATARLAEPDRVPDPGSYDLYFASGHHRPFRASRAVWLRDHHPEVARDLVVALVSDPHVGKRVAHLEEHLAVVIDELNRLAPDVVVLTGDVANLGQDAAQMARAAAFFEQVNAPLLAVIGNHDHGFGATPIFRAGYGPGYFNFARAFHPLLYYQMVLGGWVFVGFDSGPSVAAPTLNNRGLAPETLARLDDALDQAVDPRRRGVILFSHCASRASLSGRGLSPSVGAVGRMARGAEALEEHELSVASQGGRVLHLAGHTHWSDLFEARAAKGGWHYQLVRDAPAHRGPQRLQTPAAIITVQSATHAGYFRESARGWGYAVLTLGERDMQLEYVRHFEDALHPPPGDPFNAAGSR